MEALTWWCRGSKTQGCRGIICDGAVRSGKTAATSLSFLLWSMSCFHGESFGLCGKTLEGVRRNVAGPLRQMVAGQGFLWKERAGGKEIEVSWEGRRNRYFLFSGKDEGSAALIQGATLAGVLIDEAALLCRSFVEQAAARCSVEGARLWFNCNPEHPGHWFYQEWVLKRREKKLHYLHFTMEDNPSLSPKTLKQYQELYSGSFYRRFVLGQWCAAQGAVYPMFREEEHVVAQPPPCVRYVISCDYGTLNPCSMGLWGQGGDGRWYRLREYYHDGRKAGALLTDEEYCERLEELAGGCPVEQVVVDPCAASFIECIRRRGRFRVVKANNDVANGIRRVSALLKEGKLRFAACCQDCIREFGQYCWEEDAGQDIPKKEDDHAMDDMRYFVMTVLEGQAQEAEFFAGAVARRGFNL